MSHASLDRLFDAVVRVDLEFNIQHVSTRGHGWFNRVFASAGSRNLYAAIHTEDAQRLRALVRSRPDALNCDVRVLRKAETRWVNIRSHSLSATGEYTLCVLDISAWKAANTATLPADEHDNLTGLPNRTFLQKTTDRRIEENRGRFSMVMLDLDGFKKVNDTYGHVIGDAVLVETTRRLRKLLGPDDVLARLGGDAFVLLYQGKDALAAQLALKSVLLAIARPYDVAPHNAYLGVSIGLAEYPTHGKDYSSLLKNADTAMYFSKSAGKNRITVFTPTEGNADFSIQAAIHHGIQEGEFLMEFQPQFDMERRLIGAEALMRWNNRTLGAIGPNQFIPIAEASGLMPFLGKWALRYSPAGARLRHVRERVSGAIHQRPLRPAGHRSHRRNRHQSAQTGARNHRVHPDGKPGADRARAVQFAKNRRALFHR